MSTTLTLAEAIRLAGLMHPQIYRLDIQYDDNTRLNVIGSCALAGAALAAGYANIDEPKFMERYGLDKYRQLFCPACQVVSYDLGATIVHLNDSHRWTREQIATWVESIDRVDTPAPHPQSTVVATPATSSECALASSAHGSGEGI